jgi:hypothetical protein
MMVSGSRELDPPLFRVCLIVLYYLWEAVWMMVSESHELDSLSLECV